MTLLINPERLKRIREWRGLTRPALAQAARLNKQTIYRLEQGHDPKPIRPKNLDQLSRALSVNPGVLTGEMESPVDMNHPNTSAEDPSSQLNLRVHPAIRNAYELAARRYGTSHSKIATLAPLLFVVLAEASLRHRSRRLDKCRAKRDELSEAAARLPYLNISLYEDNYSEFDAEEKSIQSNDVFGRTLWKALPDGWDRENPFASFLQELTEKRDDITVEAVGPSSAAYRVFPSEALVLAGGDQKVAVQILNGEIPIRKGKLQQAGSVRDAGELPEETTEQFSEVLSEPSFPVPLVVEIKL